MLDEQQAAPIVAGHDHGGGPDAEQWIAVLPVGAIEQHGPHLPLCVDACINQGILARALELLPERLPVAVLPPQPVGKSNKHVAFPGTLTLSAETLIRLWTELREAVARAGVRKLVLFNSHGGKPQVMDIVARDLRVRFFEASEPADDQSEDPPVPIHAMGNGAPCSISRGAAKKNLPGSSGRCWETGRLGSAVCRYAFESWRPQRESNPRFRLERIATASVLVQHRPRNSLPSRRIVRLSSYLSNSVQPLYWTIVDHVGHRRSPYPAPSRTPSSTPAPPAPG
jgi:Creatinine amidohydrolase